MPGVAEPTAEAASPHLPGRTRWECERCGVAISHMSGKPLPRPAGWRDGKCLSCRQSELRAEDPDSLIRFELLRGMHPNDAQRTASVSKVRVRKVQEALIAAGELEPWPEPEPRVSTAERDEERAARARAREEIRRRVESAVRENPDLTDVAAAEECGTTRPIAKGIRARAGLPADPVSAKGKRERDLALLRSRPGGTTPFEFAAARALARNTAWKRLERLVADGFARVEGAGDRNEARTYYAAPDPPE